jgi:hypothetical protein
MGQMPARGWWLKLCVLAALNIGIFQAFRSSLLIAAQAGSDIRRIATLDYDGTGQLCQSPLSGWRMIAVALLGLPGMAMLLWSPECNGI